MKWLYAAAVALFLGLIATLLLFGLQPLRELNQGKIPTPERTEPESNGDSGTTNEQTTPPMVSFDPNICVDDDPNSPLITVPPIPDAPKLQPENQHKPLLPNGSFLIESAKQADGSMKPVRLLLEAEVCLRRGPLEVFLCRKQTKEHESILATAIDAKLIHAALVALGAKPGSTVQFIDPKTEEEAYKPATGEKIQVEVHYKFQNELRTHPAQEWILNEKTKQTMRYGWVFAGSRFIPNEDDPSQPPYYAANGGEYISVSNFVYSMLDIPASISADNEDLLFRTNTEKIPPVGTKVWVLLSIAS